MKEHAFDAEAWAHVFDPFGPTRRPMSPCDPSLVQLARPPSASPSNSSSTVGAAVDVDVPLQSVMDGADTDDDSDDHSVILGSGAAGSFATAGSRSTRRGANVHGYAGVAKVTPSPSVETVDSDDPDGESSVGSSVAFFKDNAGSKAAR